MTMVYTGNQVKKAGKTLLENKDDEKALDILSYWRSDHEVPLDTAFAIVKKEAIKIDPKALLGKRLKRTPSIIEKLDRFRMYGAKLNTMQDIAGCRVIVPNLDKVERLVKKLVFKTSFEIRNDYIANPKDDGYRSIHLVGKFKNNEGEYRSVELQVRTSIQHSWATAVEIVDIFTGQSIKTQRGKGFWPEFFRCSSNLTSLLEGNPYLKSADSSNRKNSPDTMIHSNALKQFMTDFNRKKNQVEELSYDIATFHNLYEKNDVGRVFDLFRKSIDVTHNHLSTKVEGNLKQGYILISIRPKEKEPENFTLKTDWFEKSKFDSAAEEYLELEKEASGIPGMITALISATSIGGIRAAYPNYFADSADFRKFIGLINHAYSHMIKPTKLPWAFLRR